MCDKQRATAWTSSWQDRAPCGGSELPAPQLHASRGLSPSAVFSAGWCPRAVRVLFSSGGKYNYLMRAFRIRWGSACVQLGLGQGLLCPLPWGQEQEPVVPAHSWALPCSPGSGCGLWCQLGRWEQSPWKLAEWGSAREVLHAIETPPQHPACGVGRPALAPAVLRSAVANAGHGFAALSEQGSPGQGGWHSRDMSRGLSA